MLRKTTKQLAERTEALTKELAAQKDDFSQRLFEAQQENNQVRQLARVSTETMGRSGAPAEGMPSSVHKVLYCRPSHTSGALACRSGAWLMRRGWAARMPRQPS